MTTRNKRGADLPRVLVIGGGMSGLAVAQRLAVGGRVNVVIAEAGGRRTDDHVNAIHSVPEIEDMWRIPGEDPALWRPWDSATPPHYDRATGLRRQLGGRSRYWHGVVLRMDAWALAGSSSWPSALREDGQRLYGAVEQDLTEWCGRGLQAPRSDTEERLLAWARGIGYAGAERTPLAVQHFETAAGPRWRAYSPLYGGTQAAPPVREQPSIRIQVDRRALAVNFTRQGPMALLQGEGNGRIERAAADAVVLAGGTIENTRLVAQLLADLGSGQHRYPGLSDHILQGFVVHLEHSPWGQRGAEGACLVDRGEPVGRSNLFVKLIDGPDRAGVTLNFWEMGEQEPSELTCLDFTERHALPWRPVVRTGLTEADAGVVAGQQARLQQAWNATARALDLPEAHLDFGDYLTAPRDVAGFLDQAVAKPGAPVAYATTLGSIDHESGTLPYGRLLDGSGQLFGAPGLFVVGPAAFPRPGAANPSLTTLSLARQVADEVASFLDVADDRIKANP